MASNGPEPLAPSAPETDRCVNSFLMAHAQKKSDPTLKKPVGRTPSDTHGKKFWDVIKVEWRSQVPSATSEEAGVIETQKQHILQSHADVFLPTRTGNTFGRQLMGLGSLKAMPIVTVTTNHMTTTEEIL